jgi:hypothetical protein
MPNWKKVIVSGSEASLSNLFVDNSITASIFSGSAFTGSFKGDGSQLRNVPFDDGLPDNNWDFNIPDETPINDFHTASNDYLIDFRNELLVGDPAGLIAWFGNSDGDTQLLPTNNGLIIIADDEQQGIVTSQGYSGSIVGIGNVMNFSSSVDGRLKAFATTGSNTFFGTQTISGSLLVSGSTSFVGTHLLSGSNTIVGNTVLSGSFEVSGSSNFHNSIFIITGSMFTTGSQTITGSLNIKGNVDVASGSDFYLAGNKLFNYGQFSDTTTQSGSANTAYAKRLNTTDFAHNVLIESGSRIKVLNTGIYNLQFSTQLSNTSNTNITFDIWLAYTGSNYPNSNTQIDVNKTAGSLGRSVAAWNYMLPIKANDYVELMWSCNASTGQLVSLGEQSNPSRPAIPSVIATLTQIG